MPTRRPGCTTSARAPTAPSTPRSATTSATWSPSSAGLPTATASFATKHVNRELLGHDPPGRTRVRFSLMPDRMARLLDIRTDRIADRIAAIDDFVAAGYEVHVDFSPVVTYEGRLSDWAELLSTLDAGIGAAVRRQLAAEVIFLTHNAAAVLPDQVRVLISAGPGTTAA